MKNNKIALAIHGGAGTISRASMTKKKEQQYQSALKEALAIGYLVLEKGGSAMKAVKATVVFLENCSLFNAGKGSVFTYEGKNEMDAAIMDGKTLNAGAVTAVRKVKNPILLAHEVMKKSKHVLLSGFGALEFAKINGLEIESPEYFYDEHRYQQWLRAKSRDEVVLDHAEGQNPDGKYGTVGAVALDYKGNLASATSTGGMTNKRYGRVGDSPIIGAGTYANNKTCAISCTGHGEFFLRTVMAHNVSSLMQYGDKTLDEAVNIALSELTNIGGRGGLIAIDKEGKVSLKFNTKGMYRGYRTPEKTSVKIFGGN